MAQVRFLFCVMAALAIITQSRAHHFRKDQESNLLDIEHRQIEQKRSVLKFEEFTSLPGSDSIFDLPATNMMRSILPVDLIVSYNISNHTNEIVARYASFSPILEERINGNYKIISTYACSPLQIGDDYKDKILIVLRGNCTFVNKVENLLSSELQPKAIIVADDKPYRSLITMYSATFNRDGQLKVPILFIANEDYVTLYDHKQENLELSIQTITIDNWVSLLMLIAVSPTILIILFYLCIRGFQLCHKKIVNSANEKLVKKLPVYMFNEDHLIPVSKFRDYLAATNQTSDGPLPLSSSENLPACQETEMQQPRRDMVINGVRIRQITQLHLLFAPEDFYLTSKCAICLDRFTPLRLRILVLNCKHLYHENCLSNWLINFKRTCPLCNESFSIGETLPLLANAAYSTNGSVDLENQLMENLIPTRSRRLECDSFHSCLTEPSVSIHTVGNPLDIHTRPSFTVNHHLVQETQTSISIPNTASQKNLEQTNESDANYSNLGSVDSFVTTRSHDTDEDSLTSNYITPQQTPNSGSEDSQLDTSSKLTIKLSSS